jgi:hypothetical protein
MDTSKGPAGDEPPRKGRPRFLRKSTTPGMIWKLRWMSSIARQNAIFGQKSGSGILQLTLSA